MKKPSSEGACISTAVSSRRGTQLRTLHEETQCGCITEWALGYPSPSQHASTCTLLGCGLWRRVGETGRTGTGVDAVFGPKSSVYLDTPHFGWTALPFSSGKMLEASCSRLDSMADLTLLCLHFTTGSLPPSSRRSSGTDGVIDAVSRRACADFLLWWLLILTRDDMLFAGF